MAQKKQQQMSSRLTTKGRQGKLKAGMKQAGAWVGWWVKDSE
jgi:hypothetical protein